MMTRAAVLTFASFIWLPSSTSALDDLPLVDRGDPVHLQASIRGVLKALDQLAAPLPPETSRALQVLLSKEKSTPTDMVEMQQLLDPHCLVGVTINPESRVKAARGQADATLQKGKRSVFLVKVLNDAGVTQALALTGPQLLNGAPSAASDRWLRATFHRKPPLVEKLSGREVEYLILVCESATTGKREAKLLFDVGQGTQDLGFMAEVPVLFTIKAKE